MGSLFGGNSSQQSTSSTATQAPPAYLNNAYQNLAATAQNVANTPLQQYQGQIVAGLAPQTLQGMQQVAANSNTAQPYYGMAANAAGASQNNVFNGVPQYNQSTVNSYYSPYQQDVVNATQANINETNAEQQQQVVGNAVASGAWGGDRSAIAQSELARQQDLAGNQTMAQLQNTGFTNAQQQLNTQQQLQLGGNEAQNWLSSQAANLYSGIGANAQNSAIQGANANIASGQLQQQQNQQQLNVPYQQFLQQQAYPFQTTQYLANILTGLGGVAGGTTNGSSTTSAAAPSTLSQLAGLGTVAAGSGLFSGLGNTASSGGLGNTASSAVGSGPGSLGLGSAADSVGYDLNGLGQGNNAYNVISAADQATGTIYNKGGIVRRAIGGLNPTPANDQIPNLDADFIPNTPINSHANFPNLPQPAPSSGGGNGGGNNSGSSGMGSTLQGIGQAASLAAMFMKKGGEVPTYAPGGSTFGAMSAARHEAPHISTPKSLSSMLTVPKFDVGGVAPSAANMNPMAQNANQQYAQMPIEKLQELAVRQPQNMMVHRALMQKQMLPNTQQVQPIQQQSSAQQMQPSSGLATPTLARGGSMHRDAGGRDFAAMQPDYMGTGDDGDSIRIPAPPPPSNLEQQALAQASTAANPVQSPSQQAQPQAGTGMPTYTPSAPLQQDYTRRMVQGDQTAHIDPSNALMTAGFAMMAGRSPNALMNIGEGALAGMKEYQGEKSQATSAQQKAQEMSDAADEHIRQEKQTAKAHEDEQNAMQTTSQQNAYKFANTSASEAQDLAIKKQQLAQDAAYKNAMLKQKQIITNPETGMPMGSIDPASGTFTQISADLSQALPQTPTGSIITKNGSKVDQQQLETMNKTFDASKVQSADQATNTINNILARNKLNTQSDAMSKANMYTPFFDLPGAMPADDYKQLQAAQGALKSAAMAGAKNIRNQREFDVITSPANILGGNNVSAQAQISMLNAASHEPEAENMFYNQYYDKYHTLDGAQTVWSAYQKENPVVNRDEKGNAIGANQDYFSPANINKYVVGAKDVYKRVTTGAGIQPAQPSSSIPAGAIAMLRQNPSMADAFKQKYGVDPKQYMGQ